jgi:DNA-binding CsgD family transcriptional regulator
MKDLTPRQMQILRLLALGMTNRRIAQELGLSENTVRTHVERIRRVMRAMTRGEAVARARDLGILD